MDQTGDGRDADSGCEAAFEDDSARRITKKEHQTVTVRKSQQPGENVNKQQLISSLHWGEFVGKLRNLWTKTKTKTTIKSVKKDTDSDSKCATSKDKGQEGKMMTYRVTKFVGGSILKSASSSALLAASSTTPAAIRRLHVSTPANNAESTQQPEDLIVDYLDGDRSGIVVFGLNRPAVSFFFDKEKYPLQIVNLGL